MHWIQLVNHWLWPSMVQSNYCGLLPMVQSALLVWVRDHDYGLLIYIFSNLCTSVHLIWYQSLGWWWLWFNVSHSHFLTRMSHHLVEPFDSMNYHWFGQPIYFSNWLEQDCSYNRWCHQRCHLVVSWPSCLNSLLVEQAKVPPTTAIQECEHDSMVLIRVWSFRYVEITLNTFPNFIIIKTRVFLIQEIHFISFLVGNLCGLYKFLPLRNLSRSNQAMEPWIVVG